MIRKAWYSPYVHPAEYIFAQYLLGAGITFEYEPDAFMLESGKVLRPDFFLPDVRERRPDGSRYLGKYVEVTTAKHPTRRRKRRKIEAAQKKYPEYQFVLLFREDIYERAIQLGIDLEFAVLPEQRERLQIEFRQWRQRTKDTVA